MTPTDPTTPPPVWGLRDEAGNWDWLLYRTKEKAEACAGNGEIPVRLVPAGSEVEAVLGILQGRLRVVIEEWADADSITAFGNASRERARLEDAIEVLIQVTELQTKVG